MKIDSISIKGKVTAFEISEKIFSSDINNKLISQVLYSQIANSKPRLAKTKQRNQIIGSTAKIHAQKGTGNARHASKKAAKNIKKLTIKEKIVVSEKLKKTPDKKKKK